MEIHEGKLIGFDEAAAPTGGCLTLVPLTSTRFAISENPGLSVEFHLDGDKVGTVTVEAAGLAAVYRPVH
jgi:hypothetical protein